jgi:hypothetical protein
MHCTDGSQGTCPVCNVLHVASASQYRLRHQDILCGVYNHIALFRIVSEFLDL